jgi:hypothetical protein
MPSSAPHIPAEGRRERPAEVAKRAGVKLFRPEKAPGRSIGMKEDGGGSYIDVAEIHALRRLFVAEFKEQLLSDEAVEAVARELAAANGEGKWALVSEVRKGHFRVAARAQLDTGIKAALASIDSDGGAGQ